ncbi:hypothetical protein GQ53DRAFT_707974 [Thozetella sp. PMI_491]|nr:hypothetical protein GQ53DRAFT_707974 [Thozetella sp. PMI_491]
MERKRKPHSKSRKGCGNCKLRKIKCDEAKPTCQRCAAFGVSCNYIVKAPDLQPSGYGVFFLDMPLRDQQLGFVNSFLARVDDSSRTNDSACQLSTANLAVLNRFHRRTSLTLGTERSRGVYQSQSIRLACSHRFFLHAALAFTMMHDRYLLNCLDTTISTEEVYHRHQGLALFSQKLSKPKSLTSSERDALWVTSYMLAIISLASIDSTKPEEAWPLKPSSHDDLDWLHMVGGKREVWRIADLTRHDSVFHLLVTEKLDEGEFWAVKPSHQELEFLPGEFLELLGLSEKQERSTSPYYTTALAMSDVMGLKCNQKSVRRFVPVLFEMAGEPRHLLERKEPGALLLLAYWHAKIAEYRQWWIWRRAVLECQAICIYLERFHPQLPNLQRMLHFPKSACGLIVPT